MKSEELRRKKRAAWTWRMLLCAAFFTLHATLFTSCSEENTEEEEYANWQERNNGATDHWAVQANGGNLTKILAYTKEATASNLKNSDYIYVERIETSSNTESPIATDTCRVSYRGYLIPSKSYKEGYVFDQTFLNGFDWTTAGAVDFIPQGLTVGFATALMNMHKGDRWRVYVPYQLGYGTSGQTSIPGYSNLVFEIALLDYWHPGDKRPMFKSR